ncbi:hypothetical protein Lalb_Chr02g0156951 [Lupinus albus]|uniref:Uncharacterized protein n=1 Tax=Lupinus albus TaxID=3870 RepID=A0A6A4R364_LUPAL|nr:hypothetical protein Lalb_Chr02g0156951 [Lupinus albus]
MSPIQCAPEVVRRPCVVSSPINSAAIIFIVVVRLYGDKCWKSFTRSPYNLEQNDMFFFHYLQKICIDYEARF